MRACGAPTPDRTSHQATVHLCGVETAYRLVIRLMIDVHETLTSPAISFPPLKFSCNTVRETHPIHIRQRLNLILQILRDIMRPPKGHLSIHDNVDFDKVFRTGMVNPAGVDLFDGWVEGHGLKGNG